MAKVKKNVFQGFMQEDFVPRGKQYIVKYVAGRGNNLHEVEDIEGSTYLVSMPKKFRQTVWLKKNDCLVIDPVSEGNKVRGEISCVIPVKHVVDLIETGEWFPKTDSSINSSFEKDSVINFFRKHLDIRASESPTNFSPTDSESSETDEDEEESDLEDEEEVIKDEAEKSADASNFCNSEVNAS